MVALARLAERCPGLLDHIADECPADRVAAESDILRAARARWHRSDILAALYNLTAANGLVARKTETKRSYATTSTLRMTIQQAKTTASLLPELRRQFDIERQPNLIVTWPRALRELTFRGWRSSRIAFIDLIDDARAEVTLIFPFMDIDGVDEVLRAAERALERGVKVTLVTRYLSDPGSANTTFADRLRRADATGREFSTRSINAGDESGRELLHAKVIIIDRGRRGYVGSANLTLGGLGQSIEIGVTLDGAAAESLAELVNELVDGGRKP